MIFDSMISRNEIAFQQQRTPKRRWWLAPTFYGLLVGWGMVSAWLGLHILAGSRNFHIVQPIVLVFYALVFALHLWLLLRALHISSAAMLRDKKNTYHWESLMLTGVSARELVLSKWWLAVRVLWRAYLLLGILRGVVVFTLLTAGLGRNPYLFTYYDPAHTQLGTMLFAFAFTLTLSMLNLLYTSACGVLSALLTRRGGGTMRAFLLRSAISLVTAFVPIVIWYCIGVWSIRDNRQLITFPDHAEAGRLILQYTSVLLDNGISYGSQYFLNGYWMQRYPLLFASIFAASAATYAALTGLTLRIAQWRAQHFGALHTNEVKGNTR